MVSSIVLQCLLFSLVRAAAVKRWTNGDSPAGPTDPDVVSGCAYWANDISPGDTCSGIQGYFGISMSQFVSWNPSLFSADCSLNIGWSYCVDGPAVTTTRTTTTKPTTSTTGSITTSTTARTTTTTTTTTTGGAPGPTQTGIDPNCNSFYLVQAGDSCYDITASFGNFTLSEFYAWNPAVGTSCQSLQAGYYVCVGVSGPTTTTTTQSTTLSTTTTTSATVTGPTPQQTGIVANCNKYHLVESGDGCASIANTYGILLSNFYAWNPAVGTSCGSLWLGYYVCVGTTSSQPTTTTTSSRTTSTITSTTTTATGPSPTQSGIVKTCTSLYKAQSGDTCETIVQEKYPYINSTPLFVRWNPAVGSSCANLFTGYYYCVATESHRPMPGIINTCQRYYQVKQGDSCWSIQQNYSITAAQFNRWNPLVGSSCGSLWQGYFVCVGV